jgi:hypothetical protein
LPSIEDGKAPGARLVLGSKHRAELC